MVPQTELRAVRHIPRKATTMKITIEPLAPGDLKPFPTDLGFGRNFSNRMFTQRYTPDQGWHDARIGPYRR